MSTTVGILFLVAVASAATPSLTWVASSWEATQTSLGNFTIPYPFAPGTYSVSVAGYELYDGSEVMMCTSALVSFQGAEAPTAVLDQAGTFFFGAEYEFTIADETETATQSCTHHKIPQTVTWTTPTGGSAIIVINQVIHVSPPFLTPFTTDWVMILQLDPVA